MLRIALQLKDLFHSYCFWAPFVSWFVCQLTKGIIAMTQTDEKRIASFFYHFGKTGGLPSSHSSVVVALALSLGLKNGFSSDIFVLSFFLASIVIRDAIGVRLFSGLQAKTLNSLGSKVSEQLDIDFQPVKEINGHTKFQVIVGGIIGFVTTLIFVYIFY